MFQENIILNQNNFYILALSTHLKQNKIQKTICNTKKSIKLIICKNCDVKTYL